MGRPVFAIVDVFAEEKYSGNQLAVFRGATGLSDAEMQRLAREMNYSESTFILSETPRDGGYDVRIFTPASEVPFAGHPTLGTAYIIARDIISEPAESITLNLKAGRIPVSFDRNATGVETLWMKQLPPVFGKIIANEEIAGVLRLADADIDARWPVQEVSTGLPFIIVPLKSLDALKRARLDIDRYQSLIEGLEAKLVLIFCPETYHAANHLNVRVFAEYVGITEDPATGSANGCLCGYLVKYRYFGRDTIDIRVEQGYEINRPSLLYLKGEPTLDEISVSVGGRVQLIARGELA